MLDEYPGKTRIHDQHYEVRNSVAAKDEDPRRFLHPSTIARISRLDLRARHVVEGFISGMHRSPFFGTASSSCSTATTRPATTSAHLDWKVWSKTDKFYIKQFEEETNLRTTWSWTVSNSMHYGRGVMNKYNYGLHHRRLPGLPAAAPAGRLRPDHLRRERAADHPARSQQTHIDALVKAMDVSRPRDKTDPEKILKRVAESPRQRAA